MLPLTKMRPRNTEYECEPLAVMNPSHVLTHVAAIIRGAYRDKLAISSIEHGSLDKTRGAPVGECWTETAGTQEVMGGAVLA